MKKVRVLVVGRNSAGASDIMVAEVACTQSEIDEGAHYDRANEVAANAGFEPKIAIDESDPAWSFFSAAHAPAADRAGIPAPSTGDTYEGVLRRVMDALKVTFLPDDGGGVEGADFVAEVAERCSDELAAAHMEVGIVFCDDGYLSTTGELSDEFTAIFDLDALRRHAGTGHSVSMLPAAALVDEQYTWPSFVDLTDCAQAGLSRAARHGFTVGSDNAVEVMHEELDFLDMSGIHPALNPVLERVALVAVDRSRNARRPGDRS